jgi:hypothetical protein
MEFNEEKKMGVIGRKGERERKSYKSCFNHHMFNA